MTNLINDAINGFVILAIFCAIYGFSQDMMALAGKAQQQGIMSYSKFTDLLTND